MGQVYGKMIIIIFGKGLESNCTLSVPHRSGNFIFEKNSNGKDLLANVKNVDVFYAK